MFLCSKDTSLKKWFAEPVFTGNDTTAEIIQENHYYPFGMEFSGTSYMNGQPDNPFLYQGKENHRGQQWLNLNLYDFGARMFDGQIGRWFVQDPVINVVNPYLGMLNNPFNVVDPDGKFPEIFLLLCHANAFGYLLPTFTISASPIKVDKEDTFDEFEETITEIIFPGLESYSEGGGGGMGQLGSGGASGMRSGAINNAFDVMESISDNIQINFESKVTIGVQSGSTSSFLNLWSVTLLGYNSRSNTWQYPGSQKFDFSQMNQSVNFGIAISGELSRTFDGSVDGHGYENLSTILSLSFGGRFKAVFGGIQYDIENNNLDYYLQMQYKFGFIMGYEGNVQIIFKWPPW